jgi:glycosyltransferase involved in cell wall biosynthesis
MKRNIRLIIYPFYYLYYLIQKRKLNQTEDGTPLKKGISAVIAMKDEEYTIEACIRSLTGFADQIICIDNGSIDQSVEIVKKLQNEINNLELVFMPGSLLGECRNEGLKRTKYSWHLRWDADMIAHTTGLNSIKNLREEILKSDIPRTIQLPRINLNGDLLHTTKDKVKDEGEPILMRYTQDIFYKEYGKFDSIRVPFYFLQKKEQVFYYLHCQGLKSDENLIHRFHYFTWREYTNNFPEFKLSKEEFIKRRNLYYFETNDNKKVNYRYQRQNVLRFVKYNPNEFIDYPEELKKLIKENKRFEIIYQSGIPFIRVDYKNVLMRSFIPDEDDLKWSTNIFFEKLKNENLNQYLI